MNVCSDRQEITSSNKPKHQHRNENGNKTHTQKRYSVVETVRRGAKHAAYGGALYRFKVKVVRKIWFKIRIQLALEIMSLLAAICQLTDDTGTG